MRSRGRFSSVLRWYVGIGQTGTGEEDDKIRNGALAPILENSLLGLLMMPTWVIVAMAISGFRWVPDTALDYVLKGVAAVLNFHIGARVFAILHVPGHFFTEAKQVKLGRLAKRTEAAWVWRDFARARQLAHAMKPVAGDLWAMTGDPVARFWLAISLFVLATEPRLSQTERDGLLARAKYTAKDSLFRFNDIAKRRDLGMTDAPPPVKVLGVEVTREARAWRSQQTVDVSAPPGVIYDVLYSLPSFYETVGSTGKVVMLPSAAEGLPQWRARLAPGVSLRYRTESAQRPWRLTRTTHGFGIRAKANYVLTANDDGGTTLRQELFVTRAHFPWTLDSYVRGQVQSLRNLRSYYNGRPIA